jgi:hypothetical protein
MLCRKSIQKLRGLVYLSGCLFYLAALVFPITLCGAPQRMEVSDPAAASALLAKGGRLIADYGSFQVVEAEASGQSNRVEFRDDFNFIELNSGRLDTRTAAVRASLAAPAAFAGKRLRLVQFAAPVKPGWVEELKQCGAEIVSYLPQNAYLVYGDARASEAIRSWAGTNALVQWAGDYADDYKVHPAAKAANVTGAPQTNLYEIQLFADPQANRATLGLIDRLKVEPIQHQYNALVYLNVIVRLPAAAVNQIAAQPEVVSIQPYFIPRKQDERQDQIMAGNIANNAPDGPGYLAWLADKGFSQGQFTASGFVVDVSDSGIDNGTTAPGHFDLYQLGSPAQASRVIYNRLEGFPNTGSTLSGCDGHGNLNAHIIGSYGGPTIAFPHVDAAGYFYDLGVCPFVKLGSSVVFDPEMWTSPNYADLQSQAYHSGARISANSWGGGTAGAYTADSQAYDALVRDAQPTGSTFATAGNQQMVIVFAAGNFGSGARTIMSPGTAKNVITVGAAENVRSVSVANGGNSVTGMDGCSDPDTEADSTEDVAAFSSRGPCADGRMKPDLVAPGTHITGGVAQSSTSSAGTGAAISCFKADGVCALPGSGAVGNANNFFPLGQQFYTVSTGTSHSTPAVAGGCALVRQYFINQGLAVPSPAMTKAFMMNSARYLTGVSANDSLWSPNQGMGELNLGQAFDDIQRILRDQVAADTFTGTGQTRTFTGIVSDTDQPLRVTLAWTDAPGSTISANALNNDLDLTVTIGGTTYYGNVFNGAYSVPGGSPDRKNNVESIYLPTRTFGPFTVTVTAASINSDGVPNQAPSLDQDFALVIYNAAPWTDSPPVLSAIPNRATHALAPVVLTNSASDPDAGQTLTFSLDPGAPAGAQIGAANGVFSWTPSLASANTTNPITVRVSDDALPPASNTKTFTVAVYPKLSVQGISLSNNAAIMQWNSAPGRTYRLQYKDHLNDPNWTDVVPDIPATGITTSGSVPLGTAGQRFFRVNLRP